MGDELAGANLNRSNSLAATSVAIFTFVLFFMHPGYVSGEFSPVLFQFTLVVIGVATFSFVFGSFDYYRASLGDRINEPGRARSARRGDFFWLLGHLSLFLAPSLILLAINLVAVATVWSALWLMYLVFVASCFRKVETPDWDEAHWPPPKPQSTDGAE